MYTVCEPHIHKTASVADMNFTTKLWYFALLAEPQTFIDLGQPGSWVDVRDCALGHVLSLENSAAGEDWSGMLPPPASNYAKFAIL